MKRTNVLNTKVLIRVALGIAIASMGVAGCGSDAGMPGPDEPGEPAQVSSAVRTRFATFRDWSGEVEIAGWRCDFNTGRHVTGGCTVDPGYVLVGGGAEINGSLNPGAVLTGSSPDDELRTWQVASTDGDVRPQTHSLRAYALGLRYKTTTGAWAEEKYMRNNFYLVKSDSCNTGGCARVRNPSAYADITESPLYLEGDLVIGGGAWAFDEPTAPLVAWNHSGGQALRQSIPLTWSPTGWLAQSKDMYPEDPGWVRAFAIAVRRCPPWPDPFTGCLEVTNRGITASMSGTGYWNVNTYFSPASSPDNTFALTAVGAENVSAGGFRFLSDIVPTTQFNPQRGGIAASSKDHIFLDGSLNLPLTGYLLGVRKALVTVR